MNQQFIMYWYAFPEDNRPIAATIFDSQDKVFSNVPRPDVCIPDTSVRKMKPLYQK